jgi:methionyl-tRNA synthetase
VAPVGDTDFTVERLVRCADQDLANGLGNLVNRTLTLLHKHRNGEVTGTPQPGGLLQTATKLPGQIDRALAGFDLRAATGALRALVEEGNRYIEAVRPWEVTSQFDDTLATLVHACRTAAHEIEPFLPAGAARLQDQVLSGNRVSSPRPVFRRLARPH